MAYQIKGLSELLAQFDQLKKIDYQSSLQKGGYVLQREIQTNHEYINRTGALQANENTVKTDEGAEVNVYQEYAWYVESKLPFVRPAIESKSTEILETIKADLEKKMKEIGS